MNQKLNIKNSTLNILITGAAGFIGFYLIQALKQYGHNMVGIDNLNDYYDPQLKLDRLKALGFNGEDVEKMAEGKHLKLNIQNLEFINLDLADRAGIENLFKTHQFDVVVNLGAQAGVRYSIDNPHAYVDSNLVGFVNILEGCRHSQVKHLVYASSSSVYGMNVKQPFSTDDRVDYPISLYAATKKSNELMAHTYSHLYGIPTTGLRFFTVYGPMGRPDMAYFKFTKAILEGKTIDVYNNGEMQRDFTYIDDIVEGVMRVMERPPSLDDEKLIIQNSKLNITAAKASYKVYNIGNNQPVTLSRFITAIEDACGKKAKENLMPMQAGDVPITYADVDDLIADTGFKPSTSIEEGIGKFVEWYKEYYK
ncbi:NAD-dependent epimerase [Thiosulfatimonas sediminis]|uniref:NAD-dependent epimerase n=1 Tax=Thiosulfatimonas sediminis TaxID=2675054 RepID=A0A6F8PTB0_9GAMM|nr:NAD-dependent epimerase [Thiosulfatimonas sediminis]BBP45264.1 NAD-dependent epimerase [Thiosulfatimonas sediminis]